MISLLSKIKKMIMKRLIIILQLIALFVFLQGCDKYEMIKYDVGVGLILWVTIIGVREKKHIGWMKHNICITK